MSGNQRAIGAVLGGHPFGRVAVWAFSQVVLAATLGLAVAELDRRAGGFALFLGLGVAILAIIFDLDRVMAAWSDGTRFRAAVRAVAAGDIRPDLVIRPTGGGGLAILDLESRRLLLNGRMVDFHAVISVAVRSGKRRHWLEISLADGTERLCFTSGRAAGGAAEKMRRAVLSAAPPHSDTVALAA